MGSSGRGLKLVTTGKQGKPQFLFGCKNMLAKDWLAHIEERRRFAYISVNR